MKLKLVTDTMLDFAFLSTSAQDILNFCFPKPAGDDIGGPAVAWFADVCRACGAEQPASQTRRRTKDATVLIYLNLFLLPTALHALARCQAGLAAVFFADRPGR